MTLKYVDRRSVRGRRALRDGLGGAFSQQRPEGRAALIAAHRPTEQGDPRKSRAMPSPVASVPCMKSSPRSRIWSGWYAAARTLTW
jgi:hypothetical protein